MKALFATRNAAARALALQLARVAETAVPVLLAGETGSGKSYLARRLHAASRPRQPYVVVDCAAMPEALLPAELFGHRAGAFTDATRAREGWLSRAGDGTLVLDRVDLMPASGQVALLRVLEERRFVPVGATAARSLRARIVALVGPEGETAAPPALRRDLYHRLAGFHATVPPLRARSEDILPFARQVLRREGRGRGGRLALAREAESLLVAYPWPGNFRELATVLARAAVMTNGNTIGLSELALPPGVWPAVAQLAGQRRLPLAAVERLYALWVLAAEDGNVSRAARALGISRRTLIRWRNEA